MKVDPTKIETRALWSVHAGQYQVWHTVRAEDHGVVGLSDLTTPSYYTDSEKPPLRRRKYVAHDLSDPKTDIWFWVSPSGEAHPCDLFAAECRDVEGEC